MKDLLKKLKQNWLDYLVIFISVLAICFVYTFTAFYQPKESNKNINKENIVKVLSKKEPFESISFSTEGSVYTLGSIKAENSNIEIIYFWNIKNIDILTYNGGTPNTYEYELRFETSIYSYAYKDSGNNYSISSPREYNFDIYTDETDNFMQYITIGVSYFYVIINDVYLDDIETYYIDCDLYFDCSIEIDDANDNVILERDLSFERPGTSETYNIVFGGETANQYVNALQPLINYSYSRYNPGVVLVPFEYENGYNDGVTETEDYFEELIIPEIKKEYEEIGYNNGYNYGLEIGYNNGYNDGVIAGSNNFNILNLIRSLCDLLWGVLNVEMLPNIKLIYIVSIPLVLSVVKFILGWFR